MKQVFDAMEAAWEAWAAAFDAHPPTVRNLTEGDAAVARAMASYSREMASRLREGPYQYPLKRMGILVDYFGEEAFMRAAEDYGRAAEAYDRAAEAWGAVEALGTEAPNSETPSDP